MHRMVADLAEARFDDVRLTRRLGDVSATLAVDPSASFPVAMGSSAKLEGLYRLVTHDEVTHRKVLAPHIEATAKRAKAAGTVIVAHDTTKFSFTTKRANLGRLNDGGSGFFAHFALALKADGAREPLGCVGMHAYTRKGKPRGHHHSERTAPNKRESYRWQQLAEQVSQTLAQVPDVIHVMDSEADNYALLASLKALPDDFIVRMHVDRLAHDGEDRLAALSEHLKRAPARFRREVSLVARSPKRPGHTRRNAARAAREVVLEGAATTLSLRRPLGVKGPPSAVTINIVHVREVDPPAGVEAVDWKLVTTLPIATVEDLERIVDAYRARWVIEEFFKALKTGCAFEQRQLESLHALTNALAIFTPIACDLLRIRSLARKSPRMAATLLLTAAQLLVLQHHRNVKLPKDATASDAMLAIARLGGHIKWNGEPGWRVLARGYEKLLDLVEGAQIAAKSTINP
jgi:hypothetical protein